MGADSFSFSCVSLTGKDSAEDLAHSTFEGDCSRVGRRKTEKNGEEKGKI